MDEELRLDIVEAMEAIQRADQRANDGLIGSSRKHMMHAFTVLERILKRNTKTEK